MKKWPPLRNSVTLSLFLFFTFFKLGFPIAATATTPLSDLSLESLDNKKVQTEKRNPFTPGPQDKLSLDSLSLQGIIIGPGTKYCMVSRQILTEGSKLGHYTITSIEPGEIVLKGLAGEERRFKMDNIIPQNLANNSYYDIYFENAELKGALHLIANAGKFNIIMPENLSGQVNLIFHQTTLKEAMGAILHVNAHEYTEENDIIRIDKAENLAVGGASFETTQIPLRYATAQDLVETIKPLLSDKGSILADKRTNSLTVKDRQSIVQEIWNLVARMDQRDPQVHIEAKILDVSKSFSRSLGIQWGFTKGSGKTQGFGVTDVGAGDSGNPLNANFPTASPTSGVGMLIGNLFKQTDLQAQLTAAEAKGDVRIISEPSVTTLNNTPAKIRSGLKIYVKSTSNISVGTSSASASGTDSDLQEIDTGVELTVTPQLTAENMIKLKIDAVESQADFSQTVDGIPSVLDNTASTTVLVRNGETAVIGGLIKTTNSKQTKGVPALSYIPILGWLFKSKDISKTNNELLILITPNTVAEADDVLPPTKSSYYEIQQEEVAEQAAKDKAAAQKKNHKKRTVDVKSRGKMN